LLLVTNVSPLAIHSRCVYRTRSPGHGGSIVPKSARPEPQASADTPRLHEFQHAARLTGLVGIAFSVLFVLSLIALSQAPRFDATDEQVLAYYQTNRPDFVQIGGLYLLPLAAIAFLWFVAALHSWVELSGRPTDRLMSTVQMLGGVSFVTLALAAAACATVASFSAEQYVITPDLARQFPLFGRTLLVVFGMRMAALFVMSTAKLGSGSGLFPKWFLGLSIVVALILFASASVNVWLTLIFPFWVTTLCVTIWLRRAANAVSSTHPPAS
jgi:hypothetical protein